MRAAKKHSNMVQRVDLRFRLAGVFMMNEPRFCRESIMEVEFKNTASASGACTRSAAPQYQAFPNDVSMQRTAVGLFVGWPICQYADKPRTRTAQGPNPGS